MPPYRLTLFLAATACSGMVLACTVPSPHSTLGHRGQACYPDDSCHGDLRCWRGVCVVFHEGDGGAAIGRDYGVSTDAGSPAPCDDLPPPRLTMPEVTPHATVPVEGIAGVRAETVRITSGGETRSAPVVDGRFCLTMPLGSRSVAFDVRVVDSQGCLSAPAQMTVERRADLAGTNLLAGLVPRTNSKADGELARLTDGDLVTSVTLSRPAADGGCQPTDVSRGSYLWFTLSRAREVARLVMRYPDAAGFSRFVSCGSLMVHTGSVAPPPGGSGWRLLVAADTVGPAIDVGFEPLTIRHIALVMVLDGAPGGAVEQFQPTEIEAWSENTALDHPAAAACR